MTTIARPKLGLMPQETEIAPNPGMHYPARQDPFFKDCMTTLEIR